jgi:peptidoglycan/LPS O-acetylase OafA/YrhL
MHRPTIGIIALALLAVAAASHLWGYGGEALEGASLRIGLVMAMLWLALPQTRQLKSKFLFAALAAVFAIVSFRPKMLPVLLKVAPVFAGALFVLSLFRRQDGSNRRASGVRRRESEKADAPSPSGRGPG